MKVIYLHGLGSSGLTTTAKTIQKHLPSGIEVVAPDIPLHPRQAMVMLGKLARTLRRDDIIVGTSMGGFYAQMMHGWRRILINPSLHTSRHLRTMLGERRPFFTQRRDGATHYDIDERLCREFEQLEESQFDPKTAISAPWMKDEAKKPEADRQRVLAFFADHDELTNCKEEYLQHYSRYQDFSGGHRLDPATSSNLVVPAIVNWK